MQPLLVGSCDIQGLGRVILIRLHWIGPKHCGSEEGDGKFKEGKDCGIGCQG